MNIKNKITTLGWHPIRRWSTRKLTQINKIIIHQELADGNIEAVNRYHIMPNHMSKRGCPHFCYHYGIEKNGEIIQANELNHICWHTKGQNETGIGIMLAGNFIGPGHEEGDEGLGEEQIKSLEELCDYLIKAFDFSYNDIYGHCHFGKPACPGYTVEGWIEEKKKMQNANSKMQNANSRLNLD
ncbi:N-acetylmuramoyl-L-alanine amidase [Candidatus Pacearchaeota archaeon]|nr:N-acetylmuramoyl-L-alanine amidase [Candidatus Pacearchaeota archaeon]